RLAAHLGGRACVLTARPGELGALSCCGNRTLRFTAGLGVEPGRGCDYPTGPWTISPGWISPCQDPVYRLAPESGLSDETHSMTIRIAPSVDLNQLLSLAAGEGLPG